MKLFDFKLVLAVRTSDYDNGFITWLTCTSRILFDLECCLDVVKITFLALIDYGICQIAQGVNSKSTLINIFLFV